MLWGSDKKMKRSAQIDKIIEQLDESIRVATNVKMNAERANVKWLVSASSNEIYKAKKEKEKWQKEYERLVVANG